MALTKWTPTTDLMTLRRLGKTCEELGELVAVLGRTICQGLDGVDPATGEGNIERITKESADVIAQIGCNVEAFKLDQARITERVGDKSRQMAEWEAMFPPAGSEAKPVFVVDHVGSSYGDGMDKTTVIVGHSLDSRALARGAKLYEQPAA
jgi:hypothetical protein